VDTKIIKPMVAEFLGTFYLCFAGIAAILCTSAPYTSGAGLVGVALAHGLALSIAVHVFGGISGAHVNPAVTAAMLATGRIDGASAARYVISQLAGATTAALACRVIFQPGAATSMAEAARVGIPLPTQSDYSAAAVALMEFILTFLLVISVFGTAVDERGKAVKIGAFGIGLTVAFDILAGGPVSGASMNPARSFGPALVFGFWDLHWLYWLAPIVGGVVAALVYQHVLLAPDTPATGSAKKHEPKRASASR